MHKVQWLLADTKTIFGQTKRLGTFNNYDAERIRLVNVAKTNPSQKMLEKSWNNMTSQILLAEITCPSQQNSTDTEITSKSDLDGRNHLYAMTIYLLLFCQFFSLVKLSVQWYVKCSSISASENHRSIPRTLIISQALLSMTWHMLKHFCKWKPLEHP